jgi:hypothetical protein
MTRNAAPASERGELQPRLAFFATKFAEPPALCVVRWRRPCPAASRSQYRPSSCWRTSSLGTLNLAAASWTAPPSCPTTLTVAKMARGAGSLAFTCRRASNSRRTASSRAPWANWRQLCATPAASSLRWTSVRPTHRACARPWHATSARASAPCRSTSAARCTLTSVSATCRTSISLRRCGRATRTSRASFTRSPRAQTSTPAGQRRLH